MMRKTLVTMMAALTTAALLTITASNAATYDFTFQSSDAELTATGQFTVNAADEVTSVSGAVSGLTNQTISGVTANPGFPNASYSPDGAFIYDNVFYPTGGTSFDVDGLLFTTTENPGGYWNLWGTSPGNYTLYESAGGYPIEEFGSLSVVATPEPSTWAMLAMGFVALTFVGRSRQRAPRLAPSLG